MTGAGPALKAGGPSNFDALMSALHAQIFVFFATKSVPPPPLRGAYAIAPAALTAAPPPVVEGWSSNGRGEKRSMSCTYIRTSARRRIASWLH